jgi:ABC-type branched-subunit amino acid transport system substrate-binding protein
MKFHGAIINFILNVLNLGNVVSGQLVRNNTIRFAMSGPMTGDNQAIGIDMRDGILAAFKEANDAKRLRYNLSLLAYDDGYDPKRNLENVKNIIENDDVLGMLGSAGKLGKVQLSTIYKMHIHIGTAAALQAINLTIPLKIPYIAPFTGANSLREPFNPYLVHIRPSYDDETAAMISFLMTVKLMSRIAIFYQNDSFGLAGVDGAEKALKPHRLSLLVRGTFERNTLNIENALDTIYAAKPQAVLVFALYAPASKFIEGYKRQKGFDPNTIFLAPSVVNPESLANNLNSLMDNVFITQIMPSVVDTSIEHIARYNKAIKALDPNLKPKFGSLEGYLNGRFVATVLERIQNNISGEQFQYGIYSSSFFRFEEMRLGPFYYSKEYNPEIRPEDELGCNSGLKELYFVTFNQSTQNYNLYFKALSFYESCKKDPTDTQTPIVFAHIHKNPVPGVDNLVRGMRSAGETKRGRKQLGNIQFTLIEICNPQEELNTTFLEQYDQLLVGYIASEVNPEWFVRSERDKGRLLIGLQSGELDLRKPYHPLMLHLRMSMRDEVFAMTHQLMNVYKYTRMMLIRDGNYDARHSLDVMENELQIFGESLKADILLSSTSASTLEEVLSQPGPGVQVAVIVAERASLEDVVPVLLEKGVMLAFTSLTPVSDILELVGDSVDQVLFCSSTPQEWSTKYWPVIEEFKEDVLELYSKSKDIEEILHDPYTFEGYLIASIVINSIPRISGTITGTTIADQISSTRILDLGGFNAGPFSNAACPNGSQQQLYECECNQGSRNVYFYTLEKGTKATLEDSVYKFDTCGSVLTRGK